MMKKVLVSIFVLGLLSFSLAGAQDDPLEGVDPTGVTITYWHEWDGDQQTGIDEVIRLFEESNEFGITVEQVQLGSGGAVQESLSAGVVSGDLPNLAGNGFVNNAAALFLDGVLQPLDVYFDHPEYGLTEEELAALDLNVINENRLQQAPFDGQLLAWPTGISAEVLYVNLEMLAELNEMGLVSFEGRAPQTLEEFREFACASTELTDPQGEPVRGFPLRTSSFSIYPFIYGQGGQLLNDDATAYDFTIPETIEVLEFLRDLLNDECAYLFTEGFTSDTFGAGQVPMANGSSVGLPFILGAIEASGSGLENWAMAPFPWDEVPTQQSYLRGVQMIQQTPEENLATWLFVKFWATDVDAQVAWTQAANYQPFYAPVSENLEGDFVEANPQFIDVLDIFNRDDIRVYAVPSFPRSNSINDIASNFYVTAITTDEDIEELAEEATEEANAIYEEILEELAAAAEEE